MAVIKRGEHLQDIRGGVKNHVYSDWRGRGYVRSKAINPSNPRSSAQASLRARMPACNKYWKNTLTEAQRNSWNEYAQQESKLKLSRLKGRLIIPPPGMVGSGFNMFNRNNLLLYSAGILAQNQFQPDSPTLAGLGKPNPPTSLAGLWSPPGPGYGLDFGGVNEYVQTLNEGNFDFERTDPFSLECWFKTSITDQHHFLLTKQLNSGDYRGYEMHPHLTTGVMHFALLNDNFPALYTEVYGDTNVRDGIKHHIICTNDGNDGSASDLHIYVDGRANVLSIVKDTLGANTILNNLFFQMSGRNGPNLCAKGQLFNVVVHDKSLSLTEVKARYNKGAGVCTTSGPNIVASWMFLEGIGFFTLDSSGHGNTGGLINMESPGDWVPGGVTPCPLSFLQLNWTDPVDIDPASRVRIWVDSYDTSVHLQLLATVAAGVEAYAFTDIRTAKGSTVSITSLPGKYRFQIDHVDQGGQQSGPSNVILVNVP